MSNNSEYTPKYGQEITPPDSTEQISRNSRISDALAAVTLRRVFEEYGKGNDDRVAELYAAYMDSDNPRALENAHLRYQAAEDVAAMNPDAALSRELDAELGAHPISRQLLPEGADNPEEESAA